MENAILDFNYSLFSKNVSAQKVFQFQLNPDALGRSVFDKTDVHTPSQNLISEMLIYSLFRTQ